VIIYNYRREIKDMSKLLDKAIKKYGFEDKRVILLARVMVITGSVK
jgi:hypothetical protein